MSSFKRISARDAALALLTIENPIVFIHRRPDGDAVGSGAALCEIFRQLGHTAEIISADPIPERLKFIIENAKISVASSAEGKTPVAIDVASPEQLGSLRESAPLPVLMIDHHEVGTPFADGYIVPEASSAAEALLDVALLLCEMGKIELNKTLCSALFTAMSSDTGCFAYSNATPKTHRYAAALIEAGIDAADINHRLFSSKSREQIKAEGFIASKIETNRGGRVAFATLTLDEQAKLGLKSEHFETAIDIVRSLCSAEIAFIVKETEKGEYKGSLRSLGANVAEVAARFGGGGHIRAAGCSVAAESIEEAASLLLEEIEKRTGLK